MAIKVRWCVSFGEGIMSELVRMTAAVHPFKANHKDMTFEEGVTVKDMVEKAQPDSKQIRHVRVFCRGEVIPREAWHKIKPRGGDIIEVRAFPVPRGGGGGGGKDVMRIVLTIAVVALSLVTAGAALPLLGFTATTIAAGGAWVTFAGAMVAGLVATVGMLAVNALVPVRAPQMDSLSNTAGTSDSPTLFIEGARNALSPFAPIPVVLGKYRSTPPLGAKPYTEVIGDKQYIRMLFVWGIGPLSIDLDSLKIGETPLSEFDGVQIEHREGYETDDPLTLFPSAISQDDFTVLLSIAAGWVSRTSNVFADELSVDLTFPQGIVAFNDKGERGSRSVTVEIEYRKVGAGSWSKIDASGDNFQSTAPSDWFSKTGSNIDSVTFTQNRTSAVRHGIKWGVSERGQYEIRIRRTSAESDSTQIFDTTTWSALRSITKDDPISFQKPLAKTVLVIQATDQLNSVIDDFNGIVTAVCPDWDSATETWIERATQNPASLFRHILQGGGIANPLADSRIDIEALQDWHEFCDEKGFKFNMIRDFSSSVWETLSDVAAAGRAAPSQVDGKWSVVIERERENPVSFVTPRNSFDFKAEKFFLNPVHGFRIRFPNADQGYTFDERRVYADGYSDSNATKFESLELMGVTDPDQVFKLGRFRLAQAVNQPERWSFKQDMEYLTYKRGDRIAITHDVMLVGLSSGRIKGVVLDDADVTGVTLDETVVMETGKTYGISIRTLSNARITAQVVTVEGATNSLTFVTPIAGSGSPAEPVVRIGDIFGFGLFGSESDDATVIAILPLSNFQAQMICIPYRSAVYNADTEEIPEFDTKITPLVSIPAPVINSVVSDETAMVVNATGNLRMRIMVAYQPLNRELFGAEPKTYVQIRPTSTGEPWYEPVIEQSGAGHFFIGDVRTNEQWDIRLRHIVPGRLPGPWTTISNHRVVGRSTPPSALRNMTISVFGGQALIRWDKPAELDVIFGGEVVFRHSPLFEGAQWSESVTIGQSARARTLFSVLPLKPGTYLARVYDVDGTISEEVTAVTTKQASVHAFANVDSIDEAPTFTGTMDNVEEDSGSLRLTQGSPRILEGEYLFAQGFDLLTVTRVRLTTRLSVVAYGVYDTIDQRLENIDTWESFDGSVQAQADARVFVRHTDDDPGSSPAVWSAWERLDSAEFEARAFQFKAILTAENNDYNILVDELGIDADEIV